MVNDKYQKIFEINGAHQSGVTCANLGPRSGNVLATGGKDRDVCLWTFSKRDPLMVLTGHQSYVESVIFSWNENQVAGGSMSGVIKIWDLKGGTILSTFTGHRGNITCLAHNPYDSNLWASGSLDSTAKLWDIRSKQTVNTCKGHSKTLCTMDFSPDGRWLVTGADDCKIKVWDLVAARQLTELTGHSGQVTAVQFHPNEYLLASSSSDKTVRFWDLETFECVSQSDPDSQAVQCILFHPNGACLYSVSSSALRVIGWEPTRLYDTVPFAYSSPPTRSAGSPQQKIAALAMIPSKQHVVSVGLLGADSNFSVYSTDVKQLKPILAEELEDGGDVITDNNNFPKQRATDGCSPSRLRRSFHEKKNSPLTDTLTVSRTQSSDEDSISTSEQLTIYFDQAQVETDVEVFKPKPRIKRSPPGTPVPSDPTNNERLSGSKKSGDFGSTFTLTAQKSVSPNITRKTSAPSQPDSAAGQSSGEPAAGSGTISRKPPPAATTTAPPGVKVTKAKATVPPMNNNAQSSSSSRLTKDYLGSPHKKVVHEVTPLVREQRSPQQASSVEKNVGGDYSLVTLPEHQQQQHIGGRLYAVSPEDFLPENYPFPNSNLGRHSTSSPSVCVVTEEDCLSTADKGSTSMAAVLQHRVKSSAVVRSIWKGQGVRSAVETAIHMKDLSVIVDVLNVLNFRSNLWHLDLCVMLLPQLKELFESKYESYAHTAVCSLRLVLRDFGQVIKNGLNIVPSIGVDITQEERFNKCQKCYVELVSIRSTVINKQKLSSTVNAHTYREICLLMQLLDP